MITKDPIKNEDYSNFSWESAQAAWQEIVKNVQQATGASDEEMNLAIAESARNFMDTNMLKERR